VIGLDPTRANAKFYESLAGQTGTFILGRPAARPQGAAKRAFPVGLGIAAVLLGALLAANELWSTPLRWRAAASRGVASA
jgi:hypothetical protein